VSLRGALFAATILAALGCSDDGNSADAAPASMFDTRYCEIFLVNLQGTTGTVEVYNTVGLNLCPASQWDAMDTARLKAEHKVFAVILNGPRYWTTDSGKGGSSASPTVVTIGGMDTRKVAELKGTLADLAKLQAGAKPYTSGTVLRDNSWIFKAGREVYELVAPDGKVYIMQSYSQQVDRAQSAKDLPGLAARLKLPAGWSFRARKLAATLEIKATGKATMVQDELKNSYQLR
jgi:hypothetical protein